MDQLPIVHSRTPYQEGSSDGTKQCLRGKEPDVRWVFKAAGRRCRTRVEPFVFKAAGGWRSDAREFKAGVEAPAAGLTPDAEM